MQNVIFSADDFGLTESVNEAVEQAHLQGVLGQASLMVAAPACPDAVARAKRLPALNVGLHLTLVDGDSLLGHARLPTITGPDGRFSPAQVKLALLYFFSPRARRELAAEIAAQFAAFAATGLTLHHVDAHKHMHLHPVIGQILIETARSYGVKQIRVPAEPPAVLRACGEQISLGDQALYAWTRILRRQVRRAGMAAPDHVFGLKWSGHMTAPRVRRLLENRPSGVSEIYFHPAAAQNDELIRLMPGYEHEAELQALLALWEGIDAARGRAVTSR
jgi:hopanoid biosynthesis associated protein HpnK